MARRGSRQQTAQQFGFGGIYKSLKGLIPAAVFVSQITSKDQGVIAQQSTFGGKIKTLANSVTGRATGLNLFSDVPNFGRTFNPAGAWNPFTQAAAGAIVAGTLMKKFGVPGGAKIRNLGAISLPAAIVGGVLDPPADGVNANGVNAPRSPPPYYAGNVGTNSNTSYNAAGYATTNFSYSFSPARGDGRATAPINSTAF